jgi:serine/threonine protein kinase
MNPDAIQRSGWLKRKGRFPGFWAKVYCELHQTEFYIRKTNQTQKISVRLRITPQTRIQFIDNKRSCHIRIDMDVEPALKLRSGDSQNLTEWFLALRSATFHNPMMAIDEFTIVSILGRGFFGKVMLVSWNGTGDLYALKTVHKMRLVQSQKVHTILAERNIMSHCNHPFIVPLLFAFQSATKFYLGLEYIPGGELLTVIRRQVTLPIDQVRLYVAEIALALRHLHSIGIVYRDLKPENVLIAADGHLKLTDFGLAKDLSRLRLTSSFCGTADFMAPEIIEKQEYAFSVDWWAVGILTYEMLFGQTPFHDENRPRQFMKISCHQPPFPQGADPDACDFIRKLLIKDKNHRADLDQLTGHPFWAGLNFDDVLAKRVAPVFVPTVTDLRNPENFDSEFTQEPAFDSVATPPIGDNSVFQNFSFIAAVNHDAEVPIAARVTNA